MLSRVQFLTENLVTISSYVAEKQMNIPKVFAKTDGGGAEISQPRL